MTQFSLFCKDPNDNVATHASKVEWIYTEIRNELTHIDSSSIPQKFLHGKILLTVGSEYQEFKKVWKSLVSEKRTTKNSIENYARFCSCLTYCCYMNYGAFVTGAPASRQKAMRNFENISEVVPGGYY